MNKPTRTFWAKLLSYIFNPIIFFVLMPYLVVYQQTGNSLYALKWGVFSVCFIVLGLLIVVVGRKRGHFSDFDLSKREERSKFYLLLWPLLIVYVISSIFFKGILFPLSIISVGIVVGLLMYEFINTKIKASIHVGVAVAFVVAVGILYGWQYFLFTVWIVPVIAWSRMILKRHTIQEVVMGAGLGIVITAITTIIAKLLL